MSKHLHSGALPVETQSPNEFTSVGLTLRDLSLQLEAAETMQYALMDDKLMESLARLGIIDGVSVFASIYDTTKTPRPLGDYLPDYFTIDSQFDNSKRTEEFNNPRVALMTKASRLTIVREAGNNDVMILISGPDYRGQPVIAGIRRDTSTPNYRAGWSSVLLFDQAGNELASPPSRVTPSPAADKYARSEAMSILMGESFDLLTSQTTEAISN